MEKSKILSKFNDVVYIEQDKLYDGRCLGIFNDYNLDYPKIDYDKMCQHMIDIFTTAIQKSQAQNHPDFIIICYLKPNRKYSVNMKSVFQIVTIMKSLFKDTMNKCIFVNCNKFFKIAFNLIQPILDSKLRKKLIFKNLEELQNGITNLKE